MYEHCTYLSYSTHNEVVEVYVDYTVMGAYVPATREDPEEYPEILIEAYRIHPALAKILGCQEILDPKLVEPYLDMDDLVQGLLQAWQDSQPDEPEFDRDDVY